MATSASLHIIDDRILNHLKQKVDAAVESFKDELEFVHNMPGLMPYSQEELDEYIEERKKELGSVTYVAPLYGSPEDRAALRKYFKPNFDFEELVLELHSCESGLEVAFVLCYMDDKVKGGRTTICSASFQRSVLPFLKKEMEQKNLYLAIKKHYKEIDNAKELS